MKSLVKLVSISLALFTLTGCAPSSPEDVLKAGPEATANFIAEALESGNGTKLCELINVIEPGGCKGILDSAGLGSKPTPKIKASFGGAVEYIFTEENPDLGRYFISLNAGPFETEAGRQWQYRIADNFNSISKPFGIKYDGKQLGPEASTLIMPGEYRSRVEVLTDSANWFTYELVNGEDRFKITDKAVSDMNEIVVNRCQDAQKTEAPTKSNIERFTDDGFTLVSITQIDNCQNLGTESLAQMTPYDMTWSAASSYEVKGYKMIRFWGKQNRDFTLRQGFSSNWNYRNGKWKQEDYDFYGG